MSGRWIDVRAHGRCQACNGKLRIATRKDARKLIRELPKDGPMREYRCPVDEEVWHIGHMSLNVLRGRITTREIYGR